MTNEIESAFKLAPNPNIIFDSSGKIVYISKWNNGEMLRKKLISLVGLVENPSSVTDLAGMPEIKIITKKSDGVVTRMKFDEALIPLALEPKLEDRLFCKATCRNKQGSIGNWQRTALSWF